MERCISRAKSLIITIDSSMNQNQRAIQLPRRRDLLAAVPLAALAGVACQANKTPTITHRMGEKVAVGKLMYSVLNADWKTHLGEGSNNRVPEKRFLVIEMSIANAGMDEVSVPLFLLHDSNGKTYRELENGDGVDNWMGLLRILRPTQSLNGRIVFDLPMTNYKLQVTDGGPPDEEQTSFIDIPLQMEADPVLSEPPAVKR